MIAFRNLNELNCPLVIAHRGASALEHENTILAFERAIEIGADAIELDIRRTRDRILVVHHDRAIRPTGPPISRLTYSAVLDEAASLAYHIPTLKETLELCATTTSLDIELKEIGYEHAVCSQVQEYYDLDNIAFTSFNPASLARLRKIAPDVITGLLTGFVPHTVSGGTLRDISPLARLRRCRADFLAPNWRLLRFGMFRRIRQAGVPIVTWTVNRSPSVRRLIRLGVSGIITDYPDRVKSLVEDRTNEKRHPRIGRKRRFHDQ